jgi:hypothetical protein
MVRCAGEGLDARRSGVVMQGRIRELKQPATLRYEEARRVRAFL